MEEGLTEVEEYLRDDLVSILLEDNEIRESIVATLVESGLEPSLVKTVCDNHVRSFVRRSPVVHLDQDRDQHIQVFGWTKFQKRDIEWIAKQLISFQDQESISVVEVGAGSGWLGYLLSNHPSLKSNQFHITCLDNLQGPTFVTAWDQWPWFSLVKNKTFEDDLKGEEPERRVLLLCWPDLDSSFGADVLQAFRGDYFIFIGETGKDSCCAEETFFNLLQSNWTLLSSHEKNEHFEIIDRICCYKRKST